jgi:hypothetical protein
MITSSTASAIAMSQFSGAHTHSFGALRCPEISQPAELGLQSKIEDESDYVNDNDLSRGLRCRMAPIINRQETPLSGNTDLYIDMTRGSGQKVRWLNFLEEMRHKFSGRECQCVEKTARMQRSSSSNRV